MTPCVVELGFQSHCVRSIKPLRLDSREGGHTFWWSWTHRILAVLRWAVLSACPLSARRVLLQDASEPCATTAHASSMSLLPRTRTHARHARPSPVHGQQRL